ncbi:hypothetical protein HWV62_39716 [Athelia sp. TMB]|nr:hypothetical protein HWV62_39716 [Athelia sp. TMB]
MRSARRLEIRIALQLQQIPKTLLIRFVDCLSSAITKMPYPELGASCPCTINYAKSITVPPSPLPTRIGTNYAPTALERLHIQSALVDVDSELARLDSALTQLQAAQERLQLKRGALQQYSTAHAALLSPIRRMPPEILAAIFEHLLPEHWYSKDQRSRMLPSHVCKRWRALSLSTPHFWNEISVMVDRRDIIRQLDRAKAWLARAGGCPLTVTLSCMEPKCQAQWKSALDILLPHSKRWVHAAIYSRIPDGLADLKDNLPMLESLQTSFAEWPVPAPFESAPKLCQVYMKACDLLNGAGLPWAQLTDLEVTCSSVQQSLAILKKVPNVVSYKVTLSALFDADPIAVPHEVPPLRLGNLERLEVVGQDSISGFHESLELPALIAYTYEEPGEGDTGWSLSSLSSLIARSSCPITDVHIQSDRAAGKDDVALLFQHTPCLQTLYICMGGATSNNVLQALAIRPEATCLAPQLRALFLHYHCDFDLQLLANIILLRCKPEEGTPLKSLRATVEGHSMEAIGALDKGLLKRLHEAPKDCIVQFVDLDGAVIEEWGLKDIALSFCDLDAKGM